MLLIIMTIIYPKSFLRMANSGADYEKSIGIGPSFVEAPDTVHFKAGEYGLNELFENEHLDPWVYNGLPTDDGWYKATDYNLHFYSQRDLTAPILSITEGSPIQSTSSLIEYTYYINDISYNVQILSIQ